MLCPVNDSETLVEQSTEAEHILELGQAEGWLVALGKSSCQCHPAPGLGILLSSLCIIK